MTTTYNISVHTPTLPNVCGLESHTSGFRYLSGVDEYNQVCKLCEDQTNMAGFGKSSIMPIRTDLSSLPGDLFLPTLVNGIIKTKNVSSVCLILIAIIWDVATLPIRFITLIPRVCYNALVKSKEHPLMDYLRNKGLAPTQTYKKGQVAIQVYEEKRQNGTIEQTFV